MGGTAPATILRYVRGLATSGTARGLADADLLERFERLSDGDAFAELLRRYAPLVWGTCRQLLTGEQDAEDAFQATFLALARKVAVVRRGEAVAGWLQAAAYRCALELRRRDGRRRAREQKVAVPMHATASDSEAAWRELFGIVHEEAARLPAGQRESFALCGLGGLTVCEAAARLGRPEGTVSWWLSVARERLRARLGRRGIALPGALGLLTLARPGRAAVRPALLAETARAAVAVTRGAAPGGAVSAGVLTLVREVNPMCVGKSKVLATCLLATSLAAGVAGLASQPGPLPQGRAEKGAAPRPGAGPATVGDAYGGVVADAVTDKPVQGLVVRVRRLIDGKPAGEMKLVSDAAGRFHFDLPADWAKTPGARLAVSVEAPGGFVAFPHRNQYGGDTDAGVPLAELRAEKTLGVPPYFDRMLLFPISAVKGRVLDPEGKPAAGVDVVACSVHLKDAAAHRQVRRAKTDGEGRFEAEVLSPGPAVLYLLPERYAARAIKLTDPAGDLGDYKLEAGVEVPGKLRDLNNRPLPGRWVRVGTSTGVDSDRELVVVGIGGFARWCRTGPDGTFRTAPLPDGDYQASAHGPGWDGLAERKRVGEPLEVCIVPEAVSVRGGKVAPVVLRAVPHVNVDVKITDRDGKPREAMVPYRYTFDGKEHWDYYGHLEWPTTRDGRLVIRVPHGTSRFQVHAMPTAGNSVCRFQRPKQSPEGLWALGEDEVHFLKGLDADQSLHYLWVAVADASLKVSAKDGSPLKDPNIDARHDSTSPIAAVPVGNGVFRLSGIQPDVPFTIQVKAEGYEPVTRDATVPAGQPKRIEITLNKKK